MSRRESREQAFILLFEKTFQEDSIESLSERATENRELQPDPFMMTLAKGVDDNVQELDALIAAFSRSWNKERLSRVALTLLRLALYEMRYIGDIPVSVSINEAVELAKKYGGGEDASYINGVLGGVARSDKVRTEGVSE